MNAAQSVFCHAHAAAKNGLYRFRVCGREALRDLLKAIGPSKDGPMVQSVKEHSTRLSRNSINYATVEKVSKKAEKVRAIPAPCC